MAEENNQPESFLNPSRRSYTYENSRNTGNRTRIILIVLGIIILVALIVYAAVATGGKGEEEVTVTPTQALPSEIPTPTIIESPTPTEKVKPTPTTKITPTPGKGTPTPTGSSSSTIDKTTGLDRANLSVAVQNGSGVAGAATKATNILKKLGYEVTSSGNADNFDYEKTTIQVKSTKKAYLDLLKNDLSDSYTIGSATADYTGDAEALIIIGKE